MGFMVIDWDIVESVRQVGSEPEEEEDGMIDGTKSSNEVEEAEEETGEGSGISGE